MPASSRLASAASASPKMGIYFCANPNRVNLKRQPYRLQRPPSPRGWRTPPGARKKGASTEPTAPISTDPGAEGRSAPRSNRPIFRHFDAITHFFGAPAVPPRCSGRRIRRGSVRKTLEGFDRGALVLPWKVIIPRTTDSCLGVQNIRSLR